MTDIDELQKKAFENSKRWFPTLHEQDPIVILMYMACGLGGEAGEAVDDIKKLARTAFRLGYPVESVEQREIIAKLKVELGDVFAYLANIAELINASIGDEYETKAIYNETREWTGGNG